MNAPLPLPGIRYPFEAPPGPAEAVEVAPGILWLRLPLPMKLDHVNVYALADDDGWTIVDCGFDDAGSRALWGRMTAPGGVLAGRPVARVLVTHAHPDHVGGAGRLMDRGAALLTSRAAYLMARMLWLDRQEAPTPPQLAFWRRAGMPAAMVAERAGQRPWNAADVCAPLPLGYTRLVEGQALTLAGRRWTVRLDEGHAIEHVTLWSDDGIVIGGDQLLPTISPNLGVHATEPEADPVGDWLDSCRRLAGFAQADQLVLPGHGLPFTGLPARLRMLIDNHVSALDRLAAVLAEGPRTAADCFDILYRRRIGHGEYGLALAEAVGHVNRLHREGRIAAVGETPDGGVVWGAA